MGLEWSLLSGWLLQDLVQNLIPKCVSLLSLKKELQPYGDCTRCLQSVKFSPHGNEAQWQYVLLLCLGEPALHIQQGPTVFLPKNDLWLILPQENLPQTCDLVRDALEVLAVLENPKGQPVAKAVKGSSAWVLEEKLGAVVGLEQWQEEVGMFIPARCSWPHPFGVSSPFICTAPPLKW